MAIPARSAGQQTIFKIQQMIADEKISGSWCWCEQCFLTFSDHGLTNITFNAGVYVSIFHKTCGEFHLIFHCHCFVIETNVWSLSWTSSALAQKMHSHFFRMSARAWGLESLDQSRDLVAVPMKTNAVSALSKVFSISDLCARVYSFTSILLFF